VEQFDTLLAELTVREMLLYTAELKCSLAESLAKKKRRVDSLLETLALERCANTMIGDSLARGVSGGQVRPPYLIALHSAYKWTAVNMEAQVPQCIPRASGLLRPETATEAAGKADMCIYKCEAKHQAACDRL